MTVVAVPVKDLARAKERLIRVLSPAQRRELARVMLADVLRALAASGVGDIWVVTHDAEVSALAQRFGAETLFEDHNRTHTAAVQLAQARAAAAGLPVFATVPGDVPCATPAELRALLAAVETGGRAAAFVPSRSGRGTNGVALAPPDATPLVFGEPSFQSHLAAARARGLEPRVLELPGLALDIDSPDDLGALTIEGASTESGRLVAGWKIAERLADAVRSGR